MAQDEMPVAFALPVNDLRRLIEKTRFAISVEETRYYLNGIYLHVLEDGGANLLRAVATDGHRLARVEMAQPVGANNMPSVIIPRKTVAEVQKLLEEAEGEVSLQVSDTKINFAFAEIVLTSKLIDGKFPDYTRVIPSDNDKTLKLDAKSFAQSVDRVSAISSEKSRAVKLALDKDSLALSVSNPDSGSANDELSVAYAADAMEIGFNARYLMDITGRWTVKPQLLNWPIAARPLWCAMMKTRKRFMFSCRCGCNGGVSASLEQPQDYVAQRVLWPLILPLCG